MKKLLITFLLLVMYICNSTAQDLFTFKYNKYKNGYWDNEWSKAYTDYGVFLYTRRCDCYMQGYAEDFIIYRKGEHPSNYMMRVKNPHFEYETSKKARKKRVKDKLWYEYSATVEIFTDVESFINGFPYTVPYKDKPTIKNNIIKATVKIAPYKDHPSVFNIWIEDYGLAIEARGTEFAN